MRLVTVATDGKGYFKFLKESCKRYNATLDVLGWNQKWLGFNWKNHLMLEYIKQFDDNEIVCCIDAYDTILLQPLDAFEKKFMEMSEKYHCKIVVGNEELSFYHYFTQYIFGRCKDEFLNAGTYIGRVKDLRSMFQTILSYNSDPYADDQKLLTQYCNNHENIIHIDRHRELFLTVLSPKLDQYTNDKIRIENKQLYYEDKTPAVLHANGNTRIEDIIKSLGYNITTKEYEELTKFHTMSRLKKTLYYQQFFTKKILLFVVILILLYFIYKILKH